MLVDGLERHARSLGVAIVTGERVDVAARSARDRRAGAARRAPAAPRRLPPLAQRPHVTLDLGLRERSGDPWVVSDLDSAGWIERYSAQDPTLAPPGEQLVQGQMPIRPGESADSAALRLERAVRRFLRGLARARHLAPAPGHGRPQRRAGSPGTTWRDRPAIDRGDGSFLCGDQVAAPGCLAEVSFASAIEAGRLALAHARFAAAGALSRIA